MGAAPPAVNPYGQRTYGESQLPKIIGRVGNWQENLLIMACQPLSPPTTISSGQCEDLLVILIRKRIRTTQDALPAITIDLGKVARDLIESHPFLIGEHLTSTGQTVDDSEQTALLCLIGQVLLKELRCFLLAEFVI